MAMVLFLINCQYNLSGKNVCKCHIFQMSCFLLANHFLHLKALDASCVPLTVVSFPGKLIFSKIPLFVLEYHPALLNLCQAIGLSSQLFVLSDR